MAHLEFDGLERVVEEMVHMGEMTGKVADAMLMVGAAWVAQELDRAAEREGHRDSGDMIASIGYPESPKMQEGAPTIEVYARGTDRENVKNEDKAFVNNYGTIKLDDTHWWEEGEAEADPKAVAGMAAVWDEFILTGRVPQVTGPGKDRKRRRTS
ncbi:MAG: hypothetical protein IKK34_01795 [Clostridia bacterium]|nr:hypothetical protein [Clostridia bacterium]